MKQYCPVCGNEQEVKIVKKEETYPVKGEPKISIIIPNKDHKKDLKRCIKSILKSTYKNYEIIIVENII